MCIRDSYSIEQPRVLQYEKSMYPKFDKTVLISEQDVNYLESNGADISNVEVVANGIDVTNFGNHTVEQRQLDPYVIVFVGNMESLQNFDAVLHFAGDILPLVRKKRNVIFRVVGKIPYSKEMQLKKINHVEVTGIVTSISDACHGAAAAVCPMRIGAGIQNKNLEYMAMGLPCVTTTMGHEGIPATPGKDLLIADTSQAFADQILTLIDDPAAAEKIGRSGKKFVTANMTWNAALQNYFVMIGDLLKK